MSRVPYTINIDEYICSALDQIRTMDKTRDYSGLMAAVERIQFHASRMEEALYAHKDLERKIRKLLDGPTKDFRVEVKKLIGGNKDDL